ncbi:MAG TPA: hypothetical protein VF124_08090 [Gaiellaceae bacterium]
MRFRILLGATLLVALSGIAAAFLGIAGSASAAPPSGSAYTCTGGNFTGDPSTSTFTTIPPGNYSSITIAGVCNVQADATYNVSGNLNVAPGALFDAQDVASTITIGHNVTAGAGSFLGLGCQPNDAHFRHPCGFEPDGTSVISVGGNVTATDAFLVLLNGLTVGQNVTLTGGGGADWAEKSNTIGGNFTASGITPDFFGALYNQVGGNMNLSNIWAVDPADGGFGTVNIVLNTIGRNLNCEGLGPRTSGGFPTPNNTVGHNATGQCSVGFVGGA